MPHAHRHRASSCERSVTVACDFAVIGAGPGGSFTAYQLAKKYGSSKRLCLFESKSEAGGRWFDVLQSSGLRIPQGGLRWYEFGNATMKLYTQLADELNITRHADLDTDVIVNGHRYTNMRGQSSVDPLFQDLVPRYINVIGANETDTSGFLYGKLVEKYLANATEVAGYSGMAQFAARTFNAETLDYLRDGDRFLLCVISFMFVIFLVRYRSDFDDANDTPSWMEGYLWDAAFDGPRKMKICLFCFGHD